MTTVDENGEVVDIGNIHEQVIYAALNNVMNDIGMVAKDGKNKFHGYKYASEGDLLKVLRPALIKYGIILIPSVKTLYPIDEYGNTVIEVEYTVCHKDGYQLPDKITVFGCGNDKNSKGGVGDKGIYKALTGANKYMLFKLFQVETGDDPEAHEGGHVPTGRTVEKVREKPVAKTPTKTTPQNIAESASHKRSDIEPFKGQVSEPQIKRLWAISGKAGLTAENMFGLCLELNDNPNPHALDWKTYTKVCETVEKYVTTEETNNDR